LHYFVFEAANLEILQPNRIDYYKFRWNLKRNTFGDAHFWHNHLLSV